MKVTQTDYPPTSSVDQLAKPLQYAQPFQMLAPLSSPTAHFKPLRTRTVAIFDAPISDKLVVYDLLMTVHFLQRQHKKT